MWSTGVKNCRKGWMRPVGHRGTTLPYIKESIYGWWLTTPHLERTQCKLIKLATVSCLVWFINQKHSALKPKLHFEPKFQFILFSVKLNFD